VVIDPIPLDINDRLNFCSVRVNSIGSRSVKSRSIKYRSDIYPGRHFIRDYTGETREFNKNKIYSGVRKNADHSFTVMVDRILPFDCNNFKSQ